MKRKVLITGATGDTGRAAIQESLRRGLDVRAMVRVRDDRAAALEKLGDEIVVGDLHQIDTIRQPMEGAAAATSYIPSSPG
jgi:NAD(P)H dehydrogenase (quinone)